MFSPTSNDRERLEVLAEQLSELRRDCSCGVNDACEECGGEGVPVDFYVYHHDADELQLGIRLTDLDPASKLARRAHADPEFAQIAVQINEVCDTPEDVAEVAEAAQLLGEKRFTTFGESAAKHKIRDSEP